MAGWHHRLDGHEFEYTLGVFDGQGGWRAAVHGAAQSQTGLSNIVTSYLVAMTRLPPTSPTPQFASKSLTLQLCPPFPAHSHPRRGVFLTA